MILLLILLGFVFLASSRNSITTLAQANEVFVRPVRILEPAQTGVQNPAGLAFSPGANAFHVIPGWGQGQPPMADTEIVKLTAFGERAGSARIAAVVQDPINVTFDPLFHRLLILQSPANRLVEVSENAEGDLNPSTLLRHDAQHFGLQNPQGMAVDPLNGTLFILDAAGPWLVRIQPEANGNFASALISQIDLQPIGLLEARGLAFDPSTGHLHLLSRDEQKLYELTQAGEVFATRDLSEIVLRDPQAIVFSPSGDLTDDPAETSLYVADSGFLTAPQTGKEGPRLSKQATAGLATAEPNGAIVELSFVQPVVAAATSLQASLAQLVDTSQFSPPSPDPSGLAYLPASGTLQISDREVNGMTLAPTMPMADFISRPLSGIVPLTVDFTDLSTRNPKSWAWDPGDGSSDTTQSPSLICSDPGTYTEVRTATNSAFHSTKEGIDPAQLIFSSGTTNQPIGLAVTHGTTLSTVESAATHLIYFPMIRTRGSSDIWISPEELALLPTSGPAWEQLKAAADTALGLPNLGDRDEDTNVLVLARALVYARTGEPRYRDEVVSALSVITYNNTEDSGDPLSVGRQLPAYVIAADLIRLYQVDFQLDSQFRAKLRELLDKRIGNDDDYYTIRIVHERRPNNWGAHAGAARIAIALYLGDMADLARAAEIFRAWLGDRAAYDGFKYGDDLSWQCDPANPVGINSAGCIKDGHDIGGAQPEEMRRGGSFQWPPAETQYAWEGMQGALVQAQLLHRAGNPAWQWEDQALFRAAQFLYGIGWPAQGDDEWQVWLINHAYGTDLPAEYPARYGKNMGWTDWTHAPSQLVRQSETNN